MPNINRVTVLGHVGQEPEVRYTANGKAVGKLTIATKEKYQEKEITEWHRIVVWGYGVAQVQEIHKGDLVYVEGKLKTQSWEKDGVKRYTTEINANLIMKCLWFKTDGKPEAKNNEPATTQVDDDFPF